MRIKMILKKLNFNHNSFSLINFLFCLFPISFIFGNLITNINFLLFCCLGVFHLRSKNFIRKLNFPIKIIFLFFIITLFSTSLSLIQNIYSGEYVQSDFSRLIKSILFFRFFIMLLVIYLLSEFDIINFKYFFFSAAVFPLLISIDVIFQYFFGFNVIGMPSYGHHNTSFFGDEFISGGYIQNFSFFSILLLTYILRDSDGTSKIVLTTITITIVSIAILVSGNKMSFALFLLGLFLFFLINSELRKIILMSYLIIFIISFVLSSSDISVRQNLHSFYSGVQKTTFTLFKQAKNSLLHESSKKSNTKDVWEEKIYNKFQEAELPFANPYQKLFFTAIETWKPNKIFGNGIKSFRIECHKILAEQRRGLCSNHPHNYYLEILIDTGIVGFILVMVIAVNFIIFLIKNYKILAMNNIRSLFLLAAVISLLLECFPFKSSGSFFTTNNATYIILISGIILSYKKLLEGKNFDRKIKI